MKATFERAIAQYTTGGPWSRTQGDAANVAATTDAIEKALRDDATRPPRARAEGQGEPRGVRGRRGPLRGVPLEVRAGPEGVRGALRPRRDRLLPARQERRRGDALHGRGQGHPRRGETSGPLATMRHDALYNALVALSREMDVKGPPRAQSPKAKAGSEAFARAADKYSEALDLYAQFYPKDPELPAMFYRQGRYYFDTGNYDSAVKIWGMLLEKFPNSEQAHDAGESILESFNRAKNYENIETWARRLKALPELQLGQAAGAARHAHRRRGLQARRAERPPRAITPARRARTCGPPRSSRRTRARRRRASTPSKRRSWRATRRRCKRPRSSRWARTTAIGPSRPRARGSRRRRCRRWASSARPPTSPSRWRRSAIAPELREVRSREGRRVQRRRPARGDRRARARGADGTKFLATLRVERRGRRGRVPDGPRAPERGPREGRGGALQALPRAREEPRPPRAGARAPRAGADQDRRRPRGRRVAGRGGEPRQARAAATSGRTASTPRRTPATCRARACSRSSSRSRSRETSSS